MAEQKKSWNERLRADVNPGIAKASEDGDKMYRALGRFLGLPIDPEVGTAPGPMAPWMGGTQIAQAGPLTPAGATPPLVPFGMQLGPVPPPVALAAKSAPSKPMSKDEAAALGKAIEAAQAPAAKNDLLDQLNAMPRFDISDLLPNREKIAEAMKDAPIDVRPIAGLVDSIYGTKISQNTADLQGELMQKIKNAESMMGYSPALQQVIGQGRLEEFKAKLDSVTKSEEKEFDRWYKKELLKDKDLDRAQAERRFNLEYSLEKEKIKDQLGIGDGKTITDSGKPMNNDQLKAQGSLRLMNSSSSLIDSYAKRPDFDPNNIARVVSRLKIYGGMKEAPFVGGLIGPVGELGTSGIGNSGGALQQLTQAERLYLNEARNFIGGKLRKESGASISNEEFAKEWDRFFPVAGDDAETLEAKRKARNREILARRTETGKENQKVYGEEEMTEK